MSFVIKEMQIWNHNATPLPYIKMAKIKTADKWNSHTQYQQGCRHALATPTPRYLTKDN